MATLGTGLPALPRVARALRRRRARVALAGGAALDMYGAAGGAPVVVYVHGGAWGGGAGWNFAAVGDALARHAGCAVGVLDYPLYPRADMREQAAAVACALRHVRAAHPRCAVVCLAHSSGAHVSALAFLTCAAAGPPLADLFIAQAGVYDVGAHFLYEASRCLAFVSPMLPAAGGGAEPDGDAFDAVSPLKIVGRGGPLRCAQLVPDGLALEGAAAAQCIAALVARGAAAAAVARGAPDGDGRPATGLAFPQTYVQASTADLVVPTTSNSIAFYDALVRSGLAGTRLLLYEGLAHGAFVTDWLGGGGNVHREARRSYLDVGGEARLRRAIAQHVYGGDARTIDTMSRGELASAPASHIRDACRIVRHTDAPHVDAP